MVYILEDFWLDFDGLAFLGFRLLAVRLNSAGKTGMVVEVREPPRAEVLAEVMTMKSEPTFTQRELDESFGWRIARMRELNELPSLEEVEVAVAAVRAEFAPKILNARACENDAAFDVSEC